MKGQNQTATEESFLQSAKYDHKKGLFRMFITLWLEIGDFLPGDNRRHDF